MNKTSVIIRGDVDTLRPIRATSGLLLLEGWCLLSGEKNPPAVRLAAKAFTLSMTTRVDRPDLINQMPDEAAAARCGFLFKAPLPPGIHLTQLQAQWPDGSWQPFKTLCLAVETVPFAAGLDPTPESPMITRRDHLEGWALHPEFPVKELALRYGHQDIPCKLGLQRSDLRSAYPTAAHAERSGFKSSTILGAGYGPLRLKATFADHSTAIARTPCSINIPADENIGSEIDLRAKRVGLPIRKSVATSFAPNETTHPLNILFVLHGSFASNSALHVTALANELASMGHACAVAVTHDLETLHQHHTVLFTGMLHSDAVSGVPFTNQSGPDIIHAWTTRENVRSLTEKLRGRHPSAKVLVHLEDNELHILAEQLGRSPEELAQASDDELDTLISSELSHPHRSRQFLSDCDGMTIINEKLGEFVREGCPQHLLWPAADSSCFFPRPLPQELRAILDRTEGETVLFYHGNVHASNSAEVKELYRAVLQLNREGCPTTLIRTGLDKTKFLGDLASEIVPHVLNLGQILHHHHLPELMALADYFVQPGIADTFNDYRFPSKLPEFFAIGRPVILPRTNLGQIVRHRQDAYVLDRADAAGICQAIKELRSDPALQETLSTGATSFAAKHFSWRNSATDLAKFYRQLTR